MNSKSSKCLGFKTLFEVFVQMTNKDYFLNSNIALIGLIRQLLTEEIRVKITGE